MALNMFTITARGARHIIEQAWSHLAWTDPSPAGAVDAREDTRLSWRLDAYAETEAAAAACVRLIQDVAPTLNPVIRALADRDWVTLSLEGLPPVEAGRFTITGSHALARNRGGRIPILIEAGPAFGTGHHGTTFGCLLGLSVILRSKIPSTVLDVGTGSGVLSLAALKCGTQSATGTEIDAQSVDVAMENAAKNRLGKSFRAVETSGGLTASIYQQAPYDLIFANILSQPLIRLAGRLVPLIAPGGHIILSGLLNRQEPLVRKAYSHRGLGLVQRFRCDGWSTLMFRKPD